MEITRDFLDSLTNEDIALILEYNGLLSEAKEDVTAVMEAYRFKIGEDKITIWKDQHNAEYLTHDGMWQARYLHQTYDLPVTVDSIFNAYKAEYKKKKNPSGLVDNIAEGARYFRSFAQKARKLVEQPREIKCRSDCVACKKAPKYPNNKCCFNCSRSGADCGVWHTCGYNCPEWTG